MSEVLGMVQRIQRPGNRWTAYQHDGLGKIIRADYYDDTWETFGYDKNGLLMETEKEHVTVKLERDPSGQVIKEWQNDHWISSSYDELGNRSKITSSLGAKIDVARSEMGNVSQITASRLEQEQWTASMQYNELGQEIERILPGDVISKWQYDATGRLTHHRISSQNRDTRRRAYNWDVNNRLRSMVNELTGVKVTYGYDEFSNLVWSNQGGQFDFLHRNVGNLYETKEKTDRVYGAGSRLLETREATFSYDDEGNLVQKVEKNGDTWKYEYYGNGMMSRVIKPDKEEVTFKYNSLGRRIEKCSDEKTMRFVWDGNTILHEYFRPNNSDEFENIVEYSSQNNSEIPDNLVTWVFNDGFVPSAKITDEGNYSIISDYLGTPVEAYDEEGNKVWSAELVIYGRVMEFTGEQDFIPFRYQGQYEDVQTGLYYNRFRYYDPEQGNYTQIDPIGLSGGNPTLYGYVSDTLCEVDVFGLLRRPYIRKSTREAIEKKAKIKDGRFLDSNEGTPISGGKRRKYCIADGLYDIGHKPGHEHWREVAKAEAEGLTQKEFNDRMNNPKLYHIEDPVLNQSHKNEDKSGKPCRKEKKMNKFDDTQLYTLLNESNYGEINAFLQKYGLDSVDRDGRTFLMSAIVEAKEDIVNHLVDIGCNVNNKDKSGLTALHFAAIYDRYNIVKVLITHGAEIDAVDNIGNTPLWRAIMENNNETSTIRYLLENGADPNKANNRGIAPKDLLE